MSSNSACNHTRDKQIGLPLRGRPILLSFVWLQTELDSTQSYFHYLLYRYWWNIRISPFSKNHIFTARSEDTIFIFHVWGYWCGHSYQHNYPITIELLARAHVQSIWNFIHKMASRCEDGRVIEFFSSLLEFWLFRTENVNIIFFTSII